MRLLVSVRNASEAAAAYRGGADIVDVKEPSRGSLGAADLEVVRHLVNTRTTDIPLSVACGELLGPRKFRLKEIPEDVAFAKLGLAGCASRRGWRHRLQQAWSQLPSTTQCVAVAYADWQLCGAPPPEEIIKVAEDAASIFLLDTSYKHGSLCDRFPMQLVARWLDLARTAKLRIVVAGSLSPATIPKACKQWWPDVIAVRGAACVGARETTISQKKVAELRALLDEQTKTPRLLANEKMP